MTWIRHPLGDPVRPPVVFLHGFMGSAADWLPVARQLSRDFYCLLVDLPGHGKNPLGARPGYQTWARGLADALRERGLPRVSLVGYSLGGRLALYFALRHPESVAALALESANPGISDPQERARRAAWDDENAALIRREGMEAFLAYWYDLPLFASLDAGMKATLRRERARQNPKAMAAVVRALSPGRQPDLWSRLPELKMPLLAFTGALDEKYSAIVQRIGASVPTAQTAILPNAGHNTHREQPAAVTRLLSNALLH